MLRSWWNSQGWTILTITAVVFFLSGWIVYTRRNAEGTYSSYEHLHEWNSNFQNILASPMASRYGYGVSGNAHYGGGDKNSIAPPPDMMGRGYDPNYNNASRGEYACRIFMERLFGARFSRARPDFMRNPITQERLELDLYNPELRLAVEYNGRQHYKYSKHMHQNSKDRFMHQQYRDYIKKDLCAKNGVTLIVVPYTVREDRIPAFLEGELRRLGRYP